MEIDICKVSHILYLTPRPMPEYVKDGGGRCYCVDRRRKVLYIILAVSKCNVSA